jgi:hypothetical protein
MVSMESLAQYEAGLLMRHWAASPAQIFQGSA